MATSAAIRPDLVYGEAITFDVLRNGKRIGQHVTTFDWNDGDLKVTSELAIKIKVFFVTAYRFTYDSVSHWCAGDLYRMEAHVDDNGEEKKIFAVRQGGQLQVRGPNGEWSADRVMPTEHWNREALNMGLLLNTLNGRKVAVTVEDRGDAIVETAHGQVPARHYAYRGEFEAEVWYDAAGRWVKLRAITKKDGSVIEYVCSDCMPDNVAAERVAQLAN